MSTSTIHRSNTAVEALGYTASHTDTLNKFAKTVTQGVALAKIVTSLVPGYEGVSSGLGLLAGELKTASSVINATNILERGSEWGTKSTRDSILSRWQKTANRVALTVAQFFETILFIDKCSLSFFYSAAMIACHIPILEMVKNCLYMTSAVFGLWYVGQDLSKANSSMSSAKEKMRKWTDFEVKPENQDLKSKYESKLKGKGATSEKLSEEVQKLQAEIADNKKKLERLSGEYAKQLKAKIKEDGNALTTNKVLLVSVLKYEKYLQAINEGKVKKIKEHKIEKYETRIANCKKIREKSWLSIAVDIGKIVMISLGMFVAAFSLTFPLLTLPTAALVITSMSLVSNALGLTKNIYSAVGPKVQKEPVFG
ncbi:putative uncharacterized protein [Waddlia chondrophila 2032/99]|uniref:Uncharacterized protein n=1 Tax=Waddlia chondrophila 2032/99 TaxID=765953 RepID=F8LA65_9BACT|nr:putative uncharacterized protein [Waddlia chondrophila 2032/99]